MIPQPITIDGRKGIVLYLDAQWHPVSPEQATMARVLFDDGGSAFYTTTPTAKKFDPNQPRVPKGSGEHSGEFAKTFNPKQRDTWLRHEGEGWHTAVTGERPYGWRRQVPDDYVPPPVTHKLLRTRNVALWGYSHSGSSTITGEAAKIMGIDGYRDMQGSDASIEVAKQMLEEIYKDIGGSEEPLYHAFQNVALTDFQPGDTMNLPLLATAGEPETTYGLRMEHENQVGPPTVFVFPKGTRMVGYQKPQKKDLEDEGVATLEEAYKQHGYIWSEAVVAGRFRVVRTEWQYFGSMHSLHPSPAGVPTPQIYGQVVYLEPIGYFNPATGKWEDHG